jgi:NosR/NirI family transcriptional regulator, nitrous oxide reductase regulator
VLLAALLTTLGAAYAANHPPLDAVFPGAERLGAFEGEPRAAPVYRGAELLGYLFETDDVVPIPAYSGKPVNHLVGLDLAGVITGAAVIEHHEPILLAGIPEARLHAFAAQYAGKSVSDRVRVGTGARTGFVNVDGVSGATVTVIVQNETIMRSARQVALARGIIEPGEERPPAARVRTELVDPADWQALTGDGSIRRLLITRGDVDAAFAGTPGEGFDEAPPGKEGELFIDLYYAYLNAPTIGRNLLGDRQYEWLMSELAEGEHAVAVLANGRYSFRGHGFVRGGIFDRLQLRQHDRGITFRDLDYHRPTGLPIAGAPAFSESALFIVRQDDALDAGGPWQVELLVVRQTGPRTSEYTSFQGDYLIPERYVERPEPAPTAAVPDAAAEAVWVLIWRERSLEIGVLLVALTVLTLVLMLQDLLVRRPRLLARIRNGFLLFTLFFIGWYTLAQLSVTNVLTFVHALMHEFRWETFLVDPLIFILWVFVAGSLLLWGRGVYCGWLCPFGALQELVGKVARRLRVRQRRLPAVLHERLWALKYLILLGLFGVSLHSLAQAELYAEVEPFKTAITLRFGREWGYVLYALALIAISAVNTKFYCKYLCPLGAALAVPGRMRLFDWVRRRKECGKPCQVCANECEVGAIDRNGVINANECHYCLDCQQTYYDAYKCPPLVERRKRRERAAAPAPRRKEIRVEVAPT